VTVPLEQVIVRLRREELLAPGGDRQVPPGVGVEGITTDSRYVRPATLFCAVRGTVGDGHRFLGDAAAAGAAAALVEDRNDALNLPQVVVRDGRRAVAFAAAEFYHDPWKDLTLIGVTGTNGKTTTVSILRRLLARAQPAASIGTLGVVGPDGETVPGTEGLTTPGPAQFAEVVRGLVDRGVAAIAMEVSSHALEQERVSAASFSAAIFTNLTRDHLDYHRTIDAYRAAKLKLLDLMRPGGVLVVNADEPAWEGVGREGVHLVRFGIEGRGEVQAEGIEFGPTGADWHLHTPSCTARVHLPLFGIYNVYNALGAAAALWGLGWTSDRIAEGLADLDQIPGRLERVPLATGPVVVIDYAHTPDALERALRALRPLVAGRLIVVFGAGGDRDRGKRPDMGRVAGENADLSIVTTDNPRFEDPMKIAEEIESGMGGAPRLRILDRKEAIARAIELGTPRDLVLLAGKGHETYQIWGDEYRPFDERQVVAEILTEKGIPN
jgi:UDP-N-acetylmuramoyl-L-alanyl-D-glutamate--2,6-diaminopimelate ligase